MRDTQDADVLTNTGGTRWTERLPLAIGVAAIVVAIDQITKQWALRALEPGPCSQTDACVDLVAGIKLRLVFNYGAAFSTGGDFGVVFGVLAFLMTFVLLYLASKQPRVRSLIPFAAIAGGAAGNLLDRLFRASDGFLSGGVVDFVDVGWWPVFNFADSAIVVGVIAVIVFTMLEPEPSEPADPDQTPGDWTGASSNEADQADADQADVDQADVDPDQQPGTDRDGISAGGRRGSVRDGD